jgi:tRNA-dihydrouridine synthase B
MIGRGAQGRPWIFRELAHFMEFDAQSPPLEKKELRAIMLEHLQEMHRFYGEATGVRVARKHLTWYCRHLVNAGEFRFRVVRAERAKDQFRLVEEYFDRSDGGIAWAA